MNEQKYLIMVQSFDNRWQVKNSKGHIIADNIIIRAPYTAEEYIKNYVSSFINWNYKIISLNRKKVKNK